MLMFPLLFHDIQSASGMLRSILRLPDEQVQVNVLEDKTSWGEFILARGTLDQQTAADFKPWEGAQSISVEPSSHIAASDRCKNEPGQDQEEHPANL